MRENIIAEIQRLAQQNGQAPGQILFAAETGIAQHQWRGKYWARWGDALIEAGLEPNGWHSRLDSREMLRNVADAIRKIGKMPTNSEWDIYRRSHPDLPSNNAIKRHFGRRDELVAALAKLATDNPEFADIRVVLPEPRRAHPERVIGIARDGHVYLIKSGDFYKIGRSDQLERRIKEITIALPDKATLVHLIRTDDPAGIEAYWHRRFADRRANGEWFKLSNGDVAVFRKRKFQ